MTTTWQVHGNHVLVADGHERGMIGKADGIITNQPGAPLVQRYADCTPILLYDPVRHACGIAHAGWQGTVARCAESTVRAMQMAFGCDPADLLAGIGPAIGPCCYEIGAEVVAAVRDTHADPDRLLSPGSNGRVHLDLWQPTPNNSAMPACVRSKSPGYAPPATTTSSSPIAATADARDASPPSSH